MVVYEKEILLDSHESYQTGTDRNHPVFQLNESIYGSSFYIKRVSFINQIPNVLEDITLKLKQYLNVDNTASGTESYTFTKGTNITHGNLVDILEFLREKIGGTSVNGNYISDFRKSPGAVGVVFNNTSDNVRTRTHYQVATFTVDDTSKIYALNELREMLGSYFPPTNTTSFEWFSTKEGYLSYSEVLPKNYNLGLIETDKFSYYLNNRVEAFNSFIPKYLFLHSNLSQFITQKNHLKIGNRLSVKQNDVIAVIPVETDYGSRIVYEHSQDYSQQTAIQIGNECNINNIEFYFTRRLTTLDENGKIIPEEIKVDLNSRTFQVTLKYFTEQNN
jgi:hypothetical protein